MSGFGLVFALGWLIPGLLFAAGSPSQDRELTITAPATVRAGADAEVQVSASTTVGGGERIGFFHVESSADGGRTWTPICYEQNTDPALERRLGVKAGPAGSHLRIRVRVAFRDGLAGDVDYRGAAIRWNDTWRDWREPPARLAEIAVTAR